MISPHNIVTPTAQIKLDDPPAMEVDPAATKSPDRPLLTSIQHKPFQGKKHPNIATRKASLMAQKRLVLLVTHHNSQLDYSKEAYGSFSRTFLGKGMYGKSKEVPASPKVNNGSCPALGQFEG
ncbi:hypothetical protein Aduo_014357 [Ancylostoma duodenale]